MQMVPSLLPLVWVKSQDSRTQAVASLTASVCANLPSSFISVRACGWACTCACVCVHCVRVCVCERMCACTTISSVSSNCNIHLKISSGKLQCLCFVLSAGQMPGSLRRWSLYAEQDGNVEMWARAQPHSGAFPELPCCTLLGRFFVPKTQARCHMHTGVQGSACHHAGFFWVCGACLLGQRPWH